MDHNATEFIKDKLLHFTGLKPESLQLLLDREKYPNFKDEWDFWSPENEEELRFFYISNRGYLFGNATHILPEAIFKDIEAEESVFDFGGGAGNYSIPLAFKGCEVSYFDINVLQKEFVRFVSSTSQTKINVIDHDEKYFPRTDTTFNSILALDVLEHIPNYDAYVTHFSRSLRDNGRIYIYAPFGAIPSDPTHLDDKHGLDQVMNQNGLYFEKKIALNGGAFGHVYKKGSSGK